MNDWTDNLPELEPAFEKDLARISGLMSLLSGAGLILLILSLLTATGMAYAGTLEMPALLPGLFDFSGMYAGGAGSGHDAAGAFVGGF